MDTNVNSPLVTVLMPVYNGEKYLKEAIESILHQTYTNIEFLIINDGSTDSSKEIICSISDRRILYVENESNIGLQATLNKGFQLATGDYIARMDCDDISVPHRLQEQVHFMEAHKFIGVYGSAFKIIGKDSIINYPTLHDEIAISLLFYSPFCHPTVMFRNKILKEYNITYTSKYAEEYMLWYDLSKVTKLANSKNVLLNYRIHESQYTVYEKKNQIEADAFIKKHIISELIPNISEAQKDCFIELTQKSHLYTNSRLTKDLIELIITSNQQKKVYNEKLLLRNFSLKWKNAVLEINRIRVFELYKIFRNPLKAAYPWTFKQNVYLLSKLF